MINKPTIGAGILTIQKNGGDVRAFSANAGSNVTANITVPTNTNELTNGAGFITGISSGDVTTALGYTPVNPSTLATVATSGSYSDLSDKPTIGSGILTIQKNGVDVKKFSANAGSDTTANITVPTNTNELTNGAGFITGINSGDVTTALGFTPYDADNPDGFISGINSGDVTTALGFTPADNNLSNVSTTAKVSSCGWAMPSDSKFENLTVAASGNDYAMTSSGYLMVNGSSTSTSDSLAVVNNATNMQVAARGGSGSYMRVFLPVQKGASVKLNYTSGVTINQLRFIYAVGSESEAS